MRRGKENVKRIERSSSQIIWLAGLIEGEGCFSLSGTSPVITVGMTDRDIVARVAGLFHRKLYGPYGPYKKGNKPVWYVHVNGADAVSWMFMLYSWLGVRRCKRIREIVRVWRRGLGKSWKRGSRPMAVCHPKKPHYALTLCSACYKRKRYHSLAKGRKVKD